MITLYWCPLDVDQAEPPSLIKELTKNKESGSKSFFSCPAVSSRLKNTFVFKMPNTFNEDLLKPIRPATLDSGVTVTYKNNFLFFASSPLEASFTSPYFHPPKHFKFGSVIPGQFNIGKWFRPYNCEFQLWTHKPYFYLEQGEPIFYLEALTDQPVTLSRFKMTDVLYEYASACAQSSNKDGKNKKLSERYEIFGSKEMSTLILKELEKQNA